jgi:hypothetical protein
MATPPHKVAVPGRPPAPTPTDDQSEAVSDLTRAEQAAGRETLKTFDERLKAEQEVGEALIEQTETVNKAKRPKLHPQAEAAAKAETEAEPEDDDDDDEPKPATKPASKPNPLHGPGHSRR